MRARTLIWLACGVAPLALAGAQTVPAAYTNAAHAHQVPPVMLYALSLTESATNLSLGRRPWPWTLNIAGRGERYATRQAACQALTTALKETQVVDVGLSQLNVRWQRRLFGAEGRFAEPCAALNPYANLDAAASIFSRCHQRMEATWVEAAGCYHRPAGGAPAARYRAAFKTELDRLRDNSVRVATGSTPGDLKAPETPVSAAQPQVTDTRSATPSRVTWIHPTPDTGRSHALD
jgi:hypothetical protein